MPTRPQIEILIRGNDWLPYLMEAYFDESGTHAGAVAHCMAGYLIKPDHSLKMEVEWNNVLKQYGLPFFHMVDCAHGANRFSDISKQDRIDIARSLIDIVKYRVAHGFSVMFNPSAFKPTFGPGVDKADHYSQAASFCMVLCKSFVEYHNLGSELAMYFEAGHPSLVLASQVIENSARKNKESAKVVPRIAFLTKPQSGIIQAADILAWQSHAYIRGKLEGRPVRRDLASLLEAPHQFFHLYNPGRDGGKLGINHDPMPHRNSLEKDEMIVSIYANDDFRSDRPFPLSMYPFPQREY